MSRIHAFGDDALGDLDAVGVVEALRAGRISAAEAAEAAEAAIERTLRLNRALLVAAVDGAGARGW